MANNNPKPGDKELPVYTEADINPADIPNTFVDGADLYANNRDYYIYIDRLDIGMSVKFKAFVTSFVDSFDPEYTAEQGTIGDPVRQLTSITRRTSLSFDVLASTYEEGKLNLTRMSNLARATYPNYLQAGTSGSLTAPQAPIFGVKFANLIRGPRSTAYQDGYIEKFSFEPDFESGIFESSRGIVPKVIKMNMEFLPYHTLPSSDKTAVTTIAGPGYVNGQWQYGYNYPYGFREASPTTKQTGNQANGSAVPNAVGPAVETAVNQVVKQSQKVAKSALASQGNDKSDQAQKAESTSGATVEAQLERFDKTGRSMRNKQIATKAKALGQKAGNSGFSTLNNFFFSSNE